MSRVRGTSNSPVRGRDVPRPPIRERRSRPTAPRASRPSRDPRTVPFPTAACPAFEESRVETPPRLPGAPGRLRGPAKSSTCALSPGIERPGAVPSRSCHFQRRSVPFPRVPLKPSRYSRVFSGPRSPPPRTIGRRSLPEKSRRPVSGVPFAPVSTGPRPPQTLSSGCALLPRHHSVRITRRCRPRMAFVFEEAATGGESPGSADRGGGAPLPVIDGGGNRGAIRAAVPGEERPAAMPDGDCPPRSRNGGRGAFSTGGWGQWGDRLGRRSGLRTRKEPRGLRPRGSGRKDFDGGSARLRPSRIGQSSINWPCIRRSCRCSRHRRSQCRGRRRRRRCGPFGHRRPSCR